MRETWVWSLGREDPLEKETATHSSTLAWKIPGQGSLAGYSPWGRKESDTTERLHFHFPVSPHAQCRDGYSQSHCHVLPFPLQLSHCKRAPFVSPHFCSPPPPGFPGGSVVKNLPANAEMRAKSLQSHQTLHDPMDCNPPGSSAHGVLQARRWVSCHALLQGIFLTQRSSSHLLRLLHCRWILYH